jgi:hypothetical protein
MTAVQAVHAQFNMNNHPTPLGHLVASIIKSVTRMIACGFLFKQNYQMAGILLGVAEMIGIIEELV